MMSEGLGGVLGLRATERRHAVGDRLDTRQARSSPTRTHAGSRTGRPSPPRSRAREPAVPGRSTVGQPAKRHRADPRDHQDADRHDERVGGHREQGARLADAAEVGERDQQDEPEGELDLVREPGSGSPRSSRTRPPRSRPTRSGRSPSAAPRPRPDPEGSRGCPCSRCRRRRRSGTRWTVWRYDDTTMIRSAPIASEIGMASATVPALATRSTRRISSVA